MQDLISSIRGTCNARVMCTAADAGTTTLDECAQQPKRQTINADRGLDLLEQFPSTGYVQAPFFKHSLMSTCSVDAKADGTQLLGRQRLLQPRQLRLKRSRSRIGGRLRCLLNVSDSLSMQLHNSFTICSLLSDYLLRIRGLAAYLCRYCAWPGTRRAGMLPRRSHPRCDCHLARRRRVLRLSRWVGNIASNPQAAIDCSHAALSCGLLRRTASEGCISAQPRLRDA